MTWRECEDFYRFFNKTESDRLRDLMKLFAFRNLETSRLAQYGKPADLKKYLNELRKPDEAHKENDFEDQFKGVNFEQQD